MTRTIVDLIIHPVRIRILSFLQQQPRTTAEIHALLPDVTQRTLYRHLEELVAGAVIEVAEARRVRGAVEQRYRLVRPPLLTEEERRSAGPEEWQRFFTYVTSLLSAEFAAFINARYGSEGLPPEQYVRIGEINAAPEQVAGLMHELIARAETLTSPPAEAKPYRLAFIAFPLENHQSEEPEA